MMLTTGWAVSAWLLLLLLPMPMAVAADAADVVEYKVGVLMTTRLDSPFDLERCGPAVDLALDMVNKKFLAHHKIRLKKVENRYV
jgi:atrial natriuretic peptide receptor A